VTVNVFTKVSLIPFPPSHVSARSVVQSTSTVSKVKVKPKLIVFFFSSCHLKNIYNSSVIIHIVRICLAFSFWCQEKRNSYTPLDSLRSTKRESITFQLVIFIVKVQSVFFMTKPLHFASWFFAN
jgi:hypothetical protein